MSASVVALQVVVPLLSAPVCALLRSRRLAWSCAFLVSVAVLILSVLLLRHVLEHGPVSYAMGGWAAPWGIEYRVDTLGAFVIFMIGLVASLVMPYAYTSVASEVREEQAHLFYTCYLLCLAGLLGIVVTGDAFNLFVFLEISSLSSYVLISMGRSRRALTAAFQYLIMGTIGATFILIGIGLAYMVTGTLNMSDLAVRLATITENRTVLVAFAFITVGASLKLALFPLHLWLPNAYSYAPSMVSVFLAATATKVGVYVLLRFFFTVFGAEFSFLAMQAGDVLLAFSVLAMLVASLVALFQDNVKRMLAYSSVAQIGYVTLGISLASVAGVTAGVVHLFNHALMKGALFMALGCVVLRVGSVRLRDLDGLARTMPFTMAAFVGAGLSLLGVPGTAGFVSKWYLVRAALEDGRWLVAALILVSSLVALAYLWRVVEAAYFRTPGGRVREAREAPWIMLGPTWMLVLGNVYFGLDTRLTVDVAARAAGALLGTGP